MDISCAGALTPDRDPIRSPKERNRRTRRDPPRSLHRIFSVMRADAGAAHLEARSGHTALRSLRASGRRLDCAVLEYSENASYNVESADAATCEQLLRTPRMVARLCEEDGDE